VDQAKAHFDLFGDSSYFGTRKVHDLRRMYHGLGNRFWVHPMVLLCNVCQVEACFGPFGDSVSLSAR
jgi:hypothetical protein